MFGCYFIFILFLYREFCVCFHFAMLFLDFSRHFSVCLVVPVCIIPEDCSGRKIKRVVHVWVCINIVVLRELALSVGVSTVRHMYVNVINSMVEVFVYFYYKYYYCYIWLLSVSEDIWLVSERLRLHRPQIFESYILQVWVSWMFMIWSVWRVFMDERLLINIPCKYFLHNEGCSFFIRWYF